MKFLFLILLSSCSIVGPGQVGIRTYLGKVSSGTLSSGPHFWLPVFMGITKIDMQIQKTDILAESATKDMQDLHADIAVNWAVSPELVIKTFKEIGDEQAIEERILHPTVNEVMKSVTSKRNSEEVLTKRLEMKKEIDEVLKQRLADYGIKLFDVNIVNLKFSDGFTKAVEEKQIAEQSAKKAAYDTEKARQVALAAIETAKGQAQSQALIKSTITPEILKKMAIEKWNGEFPHVMGTQTLPFIEIK